MNTESIRKSCFVINASARTILSLREICYNKMGSSEFGDNFIVYLVCVFLLIDSNCFIPGLADRRLDAMSAIGTGFANRSNNA